MNYLATAIFLMFCYLLVGDIGLFNTLVVIITIASCTVLLFLFCKKLFLG